MPELLQDANYAYIYDGGSSPFAQVNLSTGAIQYLLHDSLGSVRGVVSGSGSLTASATFDAWGETASSIGNSTNFGFAGAYSDGTGLTYLINRYYDPGSGQFLNVDPSVLSTQEPYAYTSDNPVNLTDPMGLINTCNTNPVPPCLSPYYQVLESATTPAGTLWEVDLKDVFGPVLVATSNRQLVSIGFLGVTRESGSGYSPSSPLKFSNPNQRKVSFRGSMINVADYKFLLSVWGGFEPRNGDFDPGPEKIDNPQPANAEATTSGVVKWYFSYVTITKPN
jgi:RHS repeat-associated protein